MVEFASLKIHIVLMEKINKQEKQMYYKALRKYRQAHSNFKLC